MWVNERTRLNVLSAASDDARSRGLVEPAERCAHDGSDKFFMDNLASTETPLDKINHADDREEHSQEDGQGVYGEIT